MRLDPHAPGSLEAIEAQEAAELRAEEARAQAARLRESAAVAEASREEVPLCNTRLGSRTHHTREEEEVWIWEDVDLGGGWAVDGKWMGDARLLLVSARSG